MGKKLTSAILAGAAAATATQAQTRPDAVASDPVALGWMKGAPPPPDKLIRAEDGSVFMFPRSRWSFSNWRQFFPTAAIPRGDTPVRPLPRAERIDIDGLTFTPLGATTPMTWRQAFDTNYTDGIVVLHRGRIVYERYAGALTPDKQHIAWSVTKSFVGTLAAMLVAEGKIDPQAKVSQYLPELKDSGFGDATVRQVMDMTTGIAFSEQYTDPNAEIFAHSRAGGLAPRPPGYAGPEGFLAYLANVKKLGEHGERFKYRTVNTDTLGWIVARVSGETVPDLIAKHFWRKLGMEQDAYVHVDKVGTPFAGGGLSTTLRDLARFGEMMRNGGKAGTEQIVPAAAIADIMKGGDPKQFDSPSYPSLPGWSYRNQWWISHNAHGAYMARGVHGQAIYIDPKAEMVIARYASHHIAGNAGIDPTSLPAYHALALHLMAKR